MKLSNGLFQKKKFTPRVEDIGRPGGSPFHRVWTPWGCSILINRYPGGSKSKISKKGRDPREN